MSHSLILLMSLVTAAHLAAVVSVVNASALCLDGSGMPPAGLGEEVWRATGLALCQAGTRIKQAAALSLIQNGAESLETFST